jgi:hypothetical protein
MPMEFIVPSLIVIAMTNLTEENEVRKILEDLMELEEDRFMVAFHQIIHKYLQKVWNDRHIKTK